MTLETDIRTVIERRNGKPPFTVESGTFVELDKGGVVIPDTGMRSHREGAPNIEKAIELYMDRIDVPAGKDVRITQAPYIKDATGNQVYP